MVTTSSVLRCGVAVDATVVKATTTEGARRFREVILHHESKTFHQLTVPWPCSCRSPNRLAHVECGHIGFSCRHS